MNHTDSSPTRSPHFSAMHTHFTAAFAILATLFLTTTAEAQISIPTLPPGKSVTIVTTVTVNDPPTAAIISAQDSISGSNFTTVLTDDPSVTGAANPTETPVELPDVNLAVSPTSTAEDGSGTLTYTFTREGASTSALTVNFAATGIASASADYSITSGTGTISFTQSTGLGTIVIPIGQTSATLVLSPSDDLNVETDETAILTVSTGAGYDVGTASPSATGTINNDDTDVSVAVSPAVREDGTTNLVYTFTRVGVTSGTLTVNFNVSGTATVADSDYAQIGAATYTDTAGTVTFAAAATTATVTLDPTSDNTVESDETVTLTLAAATGYKVVTPTAATGTINNDDSTVTLAVSPASVAEDGTSNLIYTFTRSGGSTTSALTLSFNVSGTATLANSDYAQTGAATYSDTAGTILIPSGSSSASITVNPTTDTTTESNETVILALAANGTPATTGGYTVGAPSTATGTINDDDQPQISVAATTPTAVEGGATGLYTFSRSDSTGALTVNFALDASSTATAGTDFTLAGAASFSAGTGTIIIPDGQLTATVTLTALTETPNPAEAAETARLNVVAGSGYLAGSPADATVTITENSFLVTTIADNSTGSLRQAVLNANSIAGADNIAFSDGTGGTVNFTDAVAETISLSGGQITLASDITISGPGADLLILRNTAAPSAISRVFNIAGSGHTVTLSGMTLTGGNCTDSGGALLIDPGPLPPMGPGPEPIIPLNSNVTVSILACSISGNSTTSAGGGLRQSSGTLTLVNSTISGNTSGATGTGAGIDSGGNALTLVNSTLSGNVNTTSSTGNAGAIYSDAATTTIQGCTITNNNGLGGASGVRNVSGTTIVSNSIIAGNLNNGTQPDVTGTFTSNGGNLIGNPGTATGFTQGSNSDQVGTGASPLNPQLASLANNGGRIQTHALLAGSPALNAGLNAQIPADTFDLDGDSNTTEPLPFDQRGTGFTRAIGTVDIGAVELQKSVSIANAAAANEGNSGTTNFVFTITRTGDTSDSVAMTYTVGGAAVNGTDFVGGTLPTGTATITTGNATTTVSIPVSGDLTLEPNEAFTVTLTAPDNGYVISGAPATSTINNDDTAGFTIVQSGGTTAVSEPGTTDTFTVVLTAQPLTNVVLDVTSGDTTEATVSPATLTFTNANWNVAQTVTVTAADDFLLDGSIGSTTTVSVNDAASNDFFDPLADLTVSVTTADNDLAGFTILESGGSTNVTEGGATDTFRVVLNAQPLTNVVFNVSSGNNPETTVSPATLTFTNANWNVAQTVIVTAVDDALVNGTRTRTTTVSVNDGTSDNAFDPLADQTISVDIVDNDVLTLSISSTAHSGADASADENSAGTGFYRITRNSILGSTTVQLTNTGSTALAADYSLTGATFGSLTPGSSGTAVIPVGQSFVDVTLTPLGDIHAEGDEAAVLNVAPDAAYTVGAPASATVTIEENDFVVINTNDAGEGTLRQAILNANNISGNDTITFDATAFATPQTITLTSGQFVISSNIYLQGTGAKLLTLNGNAASRIFNINNGAIATLVDLTATNGNHPTSWGGAINIVGGSYVILERCVVSNSTSQTQGGGIYVSNATLNVQNCTITGNTATTLGGGAIATGVSINSATIYVTNSTLSGNSGPNGGAMLCGSNAVVSLDHTTITNNSTTGSGAAVDAAGGTVTVANSLIAGNVENATKPDITGAFISRGGNLIGNNGTATGFTATNDLKGTGASPINPQLASLADNGGQTLTHALLNGSPAINNGLAVNLPKDNFDQRGAPNLRQRGPAPDSGAVEAFAFEPTLTTATTHEDVQTTSGLVITANSADGDLTTHYKIANILNGTLFKNNGTTAITSGSYITKAEGLAGLKFTPAANLNTTNTPAGFGFSAQAAIGSSAGDERGLAVPVSITVNDVNDAPTVVPPGLEDQILTIGQILTLPLSPAFTDLENESLIFSVQTNGDASKASAVIFKNTVELTGLASGTTEITILADDNQGGTVTATFTISVGTMNPTPLQNGNTATLNRQTGLFEINVTVTNTTPYPINGFRLRVDYNAYKAAHPSLILFNASSPPGASDVYLDYLSPVAVNGVVPLKLTFYTNNRRFPSPFQPGLSVQSLGTSQVSPILAEAVQPTFSRLSNQSVRLEFATVPGKWYRVRYSEDLVNWFTSEIPVQATGALTPWVDKGPPFTDSHPSTAKCRFYLVNEFPAP